MKEQILNALPLRAYLALKRLDYRLTCKADFDHFEKKRTTAAEYEHSYKPFDDTKSIFIHIPKCGGVAINKIIYGRRRGGGHTTLEQYTNFFQPSCILNYFKFTIVRNPWDRLVSAYFFLKNGGLGETDQTWFNNELGQFSSFDGFVKGWLNRENIWKWHHFRPQYHYMLDKRERVHVEFVAFLENFDDDFSYIANRIGIQRTLVRSNASEHLPYTGYYNDETRSIVAEVYAEDIGMLEYVFDNSTLAQQVAKRDRGKIYGLRS